MAGEDPPCGGISIGGRRGSSILGGRAQYPDEGPRLNGFDTPTFHLDSEEDDGGLDPVPLWWEFLVRSSAHRGAPGERVDGEDLSLGGLLRRRSSHYDELEEEEGFYMGCRRSTRRRKKIPLSAEEGGRTDALLPRLSFDRSDSLLEAVLAAKKGGWNGLKRTESLESSASLASIASSVASTSDCPCEDCFLGLSDNVLAARGLKQMKKNSNWRKVRNVVQWTPFIQTYKRHKYPWVQLAGHQGNFKAGYKQGTIMKKLCQAEETAFEEIQKDILKPFVPEYYGIVEGSDEDKYLQLQDLLSNFSSACVMDIKMGVRTYLEEELAKARHKPKLRKDMYEKMIQIDSKAPTEAEHRAKAVTKPRYMVWRETISSTATLGFRIEGIRRGDGTSSKDFKTTRTRDQVMTAISGFVEGYTKAVVNYIQRLKEIKSTLEKSKFFKSHELIGSSLLFVHNENQSGVWLIDFAKTVPLPDSVKISHSAPWVEGTHEDGYLIGLDNLIELFECLRRNPPEPKPPPPPPPPDAQQGVESSRGDDRAGKELPPDDVGHDVTTSRRVKSDDPTTEGDTTSGLPPSETGEHSLSSERGMAAPPQKGSSKNGNVSGGIERKVLDERKPD